MTALILVVDDDAGIREALAAELTGEGYEVLEARDGREALEAVRAREPALVLTDLAMPGLDGFRLIEELRRTHATPVIVLSVRGGEGDRVRALDLGADDFVGKPFSTAELLARVRAQLRRQARPAAAVLRFPGLTIDPGLRKVRQGERDLHLTPKELAILVHLAQRAGRPVSTQELIAAVWGGAPGTTPETVRVHVGSLRRKLEPDPASPRYLVTEPWVGYRFIAEPL